MRSFSLGSVSLLTMALLAFGCDDGDGGGGGGADAGSMGGAGGMGAGGMGGGAGGEGGGAGGEGGGAGGEGGGAGGEGGGAGGMGGGVGGMGGGEPMGGAGGGDPTEQACEAACERLGDCAASDDFCPDLGPGSESEVAAGCMPACTAEVAEFINSAAACADFMGLVISSSPEFAEQCGGEEEACDMACARLGECAAGEEYCPDIGAADEEGVIAGCLDACTIDVATFINGTSMCSEFMPFVIGGNEEFAAQCGEMLDDTTMNCLSVYDATCETFAGCGVYIDDGMGNEIDFADACAAGRGAIEGGFIPCGNEGDDYSDAEAVAACAAAIRAVECGVICDEEPDTPPAACEGILNAEPAAQLCR